MTLQIRWSLTAAIIAASLLSCSRVDDTGDRSTPHAAPPHRPARVAIPPERPKEFLVHREVGSSGFGDTELQFPVKNVERAPRIVEGDGGYLDLARSRDGRVLWVRRWWDDGTTDVYRFQLERAPDPRYVLQLVDGVVRARDSSAVYEIGPNVFKTEDGKSFELLHQAWVIDRTARQARRPNSGEWYPLVRAGDTPESVDAGQLQWMVFVQKCAETGGGCVYFGKPSEVCGRYFDQITPDAGENLWITPAKKCGKHW